MTRFIYMSEDPSKSKYQFFTNGRGGVGIKKSNIDDSVDIKVEANEKLNPTGWIVFKQKKTQYFNSFYFSRILKSLKL